MWHGLTKILWVTNPSRKRCVLHLHFAEGFKLLPQVNNYADRHLLQLPTPVYAQLGHHQAQQQQKMYHQSGWSNWEKKVKLWTDVSQEKNTQTTFLRFVRVFVINSTTKFLFFLQNQLEPSALQAGQSEPVQSVTGFRTSIDDFDSCCCRRWSSEKHPTPMAFG